MTLTASILQRLPATTAEIAAEEGITVRRANAMLQWLKGRGLCTRTDNKVRPTTKHRGRWPALWIRQTTSKIL